MSIWDNIKKFTKPYSDEEDSSPATPDTPDRSGTSSKFSGHLPYIFKVRASL